MKAEIIVTGILKCDDLFLIVRRSKNDDFYPGSWEFPGGHLEDGETLNEALKRELEEETGYISDNWVNLGYIYTSVGFCDEKLHLYLARDLKFKKENPDEDEIIECEEYSIEQALEMIDNGTINDAKTICAILRARKYLEL